MKKQGQAARRSQLTMAIAISLGIVAVNAAAADRDEMRSMAGKANFTALQSKATYDRFIVYYLEDAVERKDEKSLHQHLDQIHSATGVGLDYMRTLATGGHLIAVDKALQKGEAEDLMVMFGRSAKVSYIEPDVMMTIRFTPNDPGYNQQWHYFEATGGLNLPAAWDSVSGAGVTVAVLDTGITAHTDLNANIVGGYDFISSAFTARDGNGRDSNPQDQGDWFAANECGVPFASNSSWHGTHVAGTVGAVTNNGSGVAGVAFGADVVPVRVLGRCGGSTSDIAEAIIWASGGFVSGVPTNPNPADVINMSLGGGGACGATFQNAINSAVGRGAAVVVAAGNDNVNVSNASPANCNNVIAVAALDRQGNRASYSNFGSRIDITAPGGETAVNSNGVLSTLNSGTTTPAGQSFAFFQGTSMAAPHVAGLAALMLEADSSLTPAQIEATLKANARPVPGSCSGGCGAGVADAAATIASLQGGGGDTFFQNTGNFNISDGQTTESPISVNRSGNAPSNLRVGVNIIHTYRGDLVIDLVSPDGSTFRLKNSNGSDGADNVITTYTVNASGEAASGTWRLRVRDVFNGDTGFIDSWSLQF